MLNARLYLATAIYQQYIPGGASDDNLKVAHQAIDAFNDVLNMDPNNTTAISFIGQMYYNMKDFDKAKEYQMRLLKLDPTDPEPYYWVGVMDWAICFPRAQGVRVEHNLATPKDPAHPDVLPVIPEKFRKDLAEQNGPLVDEAIKALQKAISLKPNDSDSMVYLNLMYRQKAEIDEDNDTRAADLKEAEQWVDKALAAKKAVAAAANEKTPGGVVQ
jgi:tetratricopeptide (TPR) repeat protein